MAGGIDAGATGAAATGGGAGEPIIIVAVAEIWGRAGNCDRRGGGSGAAGTTGGAGATAGVGAGGWASAAGVALGTVATGRMDGARASSGARCTS